jgi:hypothetical protein
VFTYNFPTQLRCSDEKLRKCSIGSPNIHLEMRSSFQNIQLKV